MKLRRPVYYKDFHCISSECRDTCCAGWEIEVDEEAAERYERVEGTFGERLRSMIGEDEEEKYFILQPGKRCPLLRKDNLCELICRLGEESLCDICREHPRFYQWFGDYTEAGLGLCCEEASRLLFSLREPLAFEVLEDGGESQEDDPLSAPLLAARERDFCLLQNRTVSLDTRIYRLLLFAEAVQGCLDQEDGAAIEKLAECWKAPEKIRVQETGENREEGLQALLEKYRRLESLDGTWPEMIGKLQSRLPELLAKRKEFLQEYRERLSEYEQLMVYFIYRYFMEALFDGNLLSPVRFSVSGLLVVRLLDIERWIEKGSFTFDDRIQTAKLFSKEIEYCPENMAALSETCLEEPCFLQLENYLDIG